MRWSAANAIAVFLFGASFHVPARAGPWNLYAGAGAFFPANSAAFQEGLGNGFGATFGIGRDVTPWLRILLRAAYGDCPRDDDGALLVAGIDKQPFRILEMTGGSFSAWDALGEAQWTLSPGAQVVHPYLSGGVGLTSYRYEGVEIAYAYAGHTWPASIAGEEDTAACFAAGGGIRFTTCSWLDLSIDTRVNVVLRGDDALWFVPLWLTVVAAP